MRLDKKEPLTFEKAAVARYYRVSGFRRDDGVSRLLREMGLTIGVKAKILYVSPFKSPFCIAFREYKLLLDRKVMSEITVESIK